MAKNFKTLREKMSLESREGSRLLAAKYRAEMPLDELREARDDSGTSRPDSKG